MDAPTTRNETHKANKTLSIGMLLCAVAILFNLIVLLPELDSVTPALNDEVLHLVVLQKTVDAIGTGQNLTDLWIQPNLLGYPLFHHYQSLAYVLPALFYWPFREILPLAALFNGMIYLLLCVFPLTIYRGARLLGFDDISAGFAALVSPLIASNTSFGMEYGSYIWAGHGLYTQLWGMFLMPLAVGHAARNLRNGDHLFRAVLLTAATVLASLPIGYVTLGSIALIGLVVPFEKRVDKPLFRVRLWQGILRLALLLGLVFIVISFFIIPFLGDSAYMNRSVWYDWENDSGGFAGVMTSLLLGQFFDFGSLPVLTLLLLAGVVISINRWEQSPPRLALILFIFWLMLAFGRETWGSLYNLLPMGRDMQLGRLITGIHFGGILLIGGGLGTLSTWAVKRKVLWARVAILVLGLILLSTSALSRVSLMTQSRQWMDDTRTAYEAEKADLDDLTEAIKALPPGRVYAGKTADWGGSYRVGWVPMQAVLTRAGLDTAGYSYQSWPLVVDIQLLLDERRADQFNLLGIRYLVAPDDLLFPSFAREIGRYGRHVLYQIDASGFFNVVRSPLAFSGTKYEFFAATSAWFSGDLPTFGEYPQVSLAGETPDTLPLSEAVDALATAVRLPEPPPGEVMNETIGADSYMAEIAMSETGFALLKVNYHPGLRATVDGDEAEIVMLMPGFAGIPLDAGKHQVRVWYEAGIMRAILLSVGLITLVVVAIWDRLISGLKKP